MNLEERIKRSVKVTEHEIEFKGEKIQFNTMPIKAIDQEALLEKMGDSLPAVQKLLQAQKEDGTAIISGKDMVVLQTAKRQYAACVLCTSAGKKLFTSYKRMVEIMESEELDAISDFIEENVKDDHETVEEVTKN